MRPFRFSGKTASRTKITSRLHHYRREFGRTFAFDRSPWLTLFSATDQPRSLAPTDEPEGSAGREGSFPMAIHSRDRISRHRKRARKRILGAVFVLVGILLWGVAATMHLNPESLDYLGIAPGGAAVVAGIILFATTL
jgi:hypothetical protein